VGDEGVDSKAKQKAPDRLMQWLKNNSESSWKQLMPIRVHKKS